MRDETTSLRGVVTAEDQTDRQQNNFRFRDPGWYWGTIEIPLSALLQIVRDERCWWFFALFSVTFFCDWAVTQSRHCQDALKGHEAVAVVNTRQ